MREDGSGKERWNEMRWEPLVLFKNSSSLHQSYTEVRGHVECLNDTGGIEWMLQHAQQQWGNCYYSMVPALSLWEVDGCVGLGVCGQSINSSVSSIGRKGIIVVRDEHTVDDVHDSGAASVDVEGGNLHLK